MPLSFKQLSEKYNIKEDIDDQWLEPASHDKDFLDTYTTPKDSMDQDDYWDLNFSAQDDVEKDKTFAHTPTTTGQPEPEEVVEPYETYDSEGINEDNQDLANMYYNKSYDLIDEISELLGQITDLNANYYDYKAICNTLEIARDRLVQNIKDEETEPEENYEEPADNYETGSTMESINEEIKAGSLKLKDGSTVKVSKDEAEELNHILKNTKNRKSMKKDLMKSKKDFNDMLTFAKNVDESVINESLGQETVNAKSDPIKNAITSARKNITGGMNKTKAIKQAIKMYQIPSDKQRMVQAEVDKSNFYESLDASDPSSKWVKDFVDSDNPKFDGKSKKERINQALGAYYSAKRNKK